MADLQTDVRYIKGIGEARAKALSKLGIATLQDLIGYFPRRYEDRTMTRTIRELELGETVCVRAMIANDPVASRISGGRTVVKARAVDDSGVLDELDRLANMGNDGDEDDPDANSTVDEYSSADRDLFSQCVEMAVRDREVSTSLIQRRLKLGYARAGRLVDEMEQRGIISAKDGAKPRRCLISMEQYEAMKASGELK